MVGDNALAMRLASALQARGFDIRAIQAANRADQLSPFANFTYTQRRGG